MQFTDITVDVAGQQQSTRQHDTSRLESGVVAIFARMIREHGPCFDRPIPMPGLIYIRLRLTSTFTSGPPTAALATFTTHGEMVITTSALLAGIDDQADGQVMRAFAETIMRGIHDTGIEPGFDADAFHERPAIIGVRWPNPKVDPADLELVADMATCLAAAFFGQTVSG
jgi:hypothetical protein